MSFWLDNPAELVSTDVLPLADKPVNERLNSFVRLSIVVFAISLIVTRQSASVLIPAIAMIVSVYLERTQNECVKACARKEGIKKEGFQRAQNPQTARSVKRKNRKSRPKKPFKPAKGCALPNPDLIKRDALNPSVRNNRLVGEQPALNDMCVRQEACEEPMVDEQEMVDLLNQLSGKPVPYDFKYSPYSRSSIGATKRQCEYMAANKNSDLGTVPPSREEAMAELMASRMRSDNLVYCDNPDFDAAAVWGTGGRSLGGYNVID